MDIKKTFNKLLRQSMIDSGLVQSTDKDGKPVFDKEGEEEWIGTEKQWQRFYAERDELERQLDDPPEGSVFHPQYNPQQDIHNIPF